VGGCVRACVCVCLCLCVGVGVGVDVCVCDCVCEKESAGWVAPRPHTHHAYSSKAADRLREC